MYVRRSHPNLFIVLGFIVAFNGLQAIVHLFGPERAFATPSLTYVNYIDPKVWGAGFAGAAVLTTIGMNRTSTYHVARIGLAIGMLVCAFRLVMLAAAGSVALTGMPTWMLAFGIHLATLMEAPTNPSTAT